MANVMLTRMAVTALMATLSYLLSITTSVRTLTSVCLTSVAMTFHSTATVGTQTETSSASVTRDSGMAASVVRTD